MTRAERLGLEPSSEDQNARDPWPSNNECAHSIAISLKRLADAFERAESHATGRQP